jgi:hypothetical protein
VPYLVKEIKDIKKTNEEKINNLISENKLLNEKVNLLENKINEILKLMKN